MILIDANILLYAYHPRAAEHAAARRWLERALSGPALVGLSWQGILAFLRISTSGRVFDHPLSMREATAAVSAWLALPSVSVLSPGERHWDILDALLAKAQVTGPLVMDAAVAALAIEHGAVLQTADRDFSRFPGLKFENPLSW